ncbi:hypothetical protein AAF712_013839 [Marasmius tenuissimus]|uniref:Glyoxalase-like domain-containing protein n=1 Tax=Marasmius tenuissimus TaxID=585030 RepID=A0ABR2ZDL5_9AGAR
MTTKTLDHIVHLTPPGSVDQTAQQFKDLGFKVVRGGKHTDGLTENVQVALSDGVYLELISFIHPVSWYPPGSPERLKRENHKWAGMPHGWIDYAFLGNDGSGDIYIPETRGGRERPDGQMVKWLLTSPITNKVATVPFFCGDVTDRLLRVPMEPHSNIEHPSTALGIAHVRLACNLSNAQALAQDITYVVGDSPKRLSPTYFEWELRSIYPTAGGPSRLILEAVDGISGHSISELGIYVEKAPEQDSSTTPYGKIAWVRA